MKVSIVLRPDMEIQERISGKATELFIRYGIRSITMDEIALQLGISKKTIYQFFADKNELVEAVIVHIVENNRSCCEVYRAGAENAIHEVFMAMELMRQMFEHMNPAMLYDLEKYHPSAFEKFIEFKHKFLFRIICENLEKGVKEGLYRQDMDASIIAQLRLESIMLPFSMNVFSRSKFNLVDVQQQIMEHYLFGVASLKGYHLIEKYKEERRKNSKHEQNTF